MLVVAAPDPPLRQVAQTVSVRHVLSDIWTECFLRAPPTMSALVSVELSIWHLIALDGSTQVHQCVLEVIRLLLFHQSIF